MGDVRRAVAQAMRYAGCLNRRSLGVSDVFLRVAQVGRAGQATGGRGEAGVGDVRRAVAQAMRDAGCPNRRSLSLSEVYPLPKVVCAPGGHTRR